MADGADDVVLDFGEDTVGRRIVMPKTTWEAIRYEAEERGVDPSQVMVDLIHVGMSEFPFRPEPKPSTDEAGDPALEGFS